MAYLLYFIAGALAANGMPHFVKGIMRQAHETPFRKPAGAMLNVVWGTANFFLAGLLILFAAQFPFAIAYAFFAFFIGFLIAGIRLSGAWERRTPSARPLTYRGA